MLFTQFPKLTLQTLLPLNSGQACGQQQTKEWPMAITNTFSHFSFIIKSKHSIDLLFPIVNIAKHFDIDEIFSSETQKVTKRIFDVLVADIRYQTS